jgi:hypothetical protein
VNGGGKQNVAAKRQKVNRSALIRETFPEDLACCVCWNLRNETGSVIKLSRSAARNIFLGRRLRRGLKIELRRRSPFQFLHGLTKRLSPE